jgi:hypothetical protein
MTGHMDLFERLAEPFPREELKILPKAGGIFFITARQVMNRMDDVLGPENWWDDYSPVGRNKAVLCRLTIRLPDGSLLTKSDAGGAAELKNQEDDSKSPYSYALKRTAVKFGIARELYRDGVANLRFALDSVQGSPVSLLAAVAESLIHSMESGTPAPVPHEPMRATPQPADGRSLIAWAFAASKSYGIDLVHKVRVWGNQHSLEPDPKTWDIRWVIDCHADMAKFLDERGLLDIPPEARSQMPVSSPAKDPLGPVPGSLTIDPRDIHKPIKLQIKELGKKLHAAAFSEPPTEDSVMSFIRTRCKDHQIVVPESIRNLSSREHLSLILKALQEDERDMKVLS